MKLLHRVLVLVICGVICLSLTPISIEPDKDHVFDLLSSKNLPY